MNPTEIHTSGEVAEALKLELLGDANVPIMRVSSLENATVGSISFVVNPKLLNRARDCMASALIIPSALRDQPLNAATLCRFPSDNPYLSYAKLTQFWAQHRWQGKGSIHPSAVVDAEASVAESAFIGAGAVISAGAQISEHAIVAAGAYIGPFVTVGARSNIYANATIHHESVIGSDCEIHSGAVIGADGFGWAPDKSGWEKICQLGRVRIGNKVSVGACTTIDRGAIDDTVIEDGVILDNQIQVAHNVIIGSNTAIAGCTGIAGSASIGKNCRIGGAVSIVGHIKICDDVLITANSFVNRSIKEPGSYSSGFPLEDSLTWRKNAVRLHKLDALSRDINKLKNSIL